MLLLQEEDEWVNWKAEYSWKPNAKPVSPRAAQHNRSSGRNTTASSSSATLPADAFGPSPDAHAVLAALKKRNRMGGEPCLQSCLFPVIEFCLPACTLSATEVMLKC